LFEIIISISILTTQTRITNTKLQLITLGLFLYSSSIYAQLHHQTIGALGGSQTKSNYYVSHSVGQSSVVGTSQLNSTLISCALYWRHYGQKTNSTMCKSGKEFELV